MRDSEVHVQAARRAADAAKDQSAQSALALRQFEASNLVVTASDVRAERDARDVIWNAIKSGLSVLSESAEDLDRGIKAADYKADGLLANATEAERLQSLRDVAEADADKARTAEAGWSARARERAELDEQWTLLASRFALDEMPIGEALAWLGRRSTAVGVADRIKIAKEEYATLAADFDATWQALKSELAAVGTQFPDSLSMSWLIQAAESVVGSAEKARADRSGLEARRAACGAHQLVLQDRTLAAHAEFREWESEWRQAIAAAHLDGVATGVAAVGAAAEAAQGLSAILQKIDSVRRERVDTMQADLNRLDETAARLGVKVGGLPDGLTGREVSFELSSRLAASIAGKTLYDQAAVVLDRAKVRRQESKAKIDQITASLESTLKLVGVTTVADALQVVEIAERKRRLTAELGDETRTILQSGDGLDLAGIETEVDGAAIGVIPARLEELNDLLSRVSDALTQLTERRVQAEQKLSVIAGGESAAIAESKRHEAIADMVEAADRYLRVKTSAALLQWATERYRETHQGPLLKRAGEVFSGLTLGQFSRLVVDFEKKPFELSAQTGGGRFVKVSGMSEGTRDQLYFALRIAALELHLRQSAPLPFIADDLFVNFDDERARAGLSALKELSTHTQVIFLTHHDHLLNVIAEVFGAEVNVVRLTREQNVETST